MPSANPHDYGVAALDALVSASRQYRYLPERFAPDHLIVTCAVPVSQALGGIGTEPLWLQHVDPTSGGKSEDIKLADLVTQERVKDLTLAGLLSGKETKRGQLRIVNPVGLLARHENEDFMMTIADLTHILSRNGGAPRSGGAQDNLLSALREVYDGVYGREMYGMTLSWEGKVTILAGATPAIDIYSAFGGELGTRWLQYRWPKLTVEEQKLVSRAVRQRGTSITAARNEARRIATEIIRAGQLAVGTVELSEATGDLIDCCALTIAHGRASVPRSAYGDNDIIGVADSEGVGRATHELVLLAKALYALGLGDDVAHRILRHTALSTMPANRRKVLSNVVRSPAPVTCFGVQKATGLSYRPVSTALYDWRAVGVLDHGAGEDDVADARLWYPTEEFLPHLKVVMP